MNFFEWWDSRDPEIVAVTPAVAIARPAWEASALACAELCRKEGCICETLLAAGEANLPDGFWSDPFSVPVHDPRCPEALALAIEAKMGGAARR